MPRSYDRMLDVTEHYYGYGDEDYGRAREEDERYWYEQEHGRPSAQAYGDRPPYGWDLREGLHADARGERENLRGGAMEWTARARGPGKAPKGYTRSDERIREDICERLMRAPYDASDVEVAVSSGEVTLTGTVRTRADKWGIEDVADMVLGVQDMHNQIRVNRGAETSESTTLSGDTRKFHA